MTWRKVPVERVKALGGKVKALGFVSLSMFFCDFCGLGDFFG